MGSSYKHKQVGVMLIFVLGMIGLVCALFAWGALGSGMTPISAKAATILQSVVIVDAVLLLLFYALTVTVEGGKIGLAFGIGFLRRMIPLEDVVAVQVVLNKWYYGWGIRLTPQGWLWNIAGLKAVELTLKNGKKFRIGTDEPEALQQAIRNV